MSNTIPTTLRRSPRFEKKKLTFTKVTNAMRSPRRDKKRRMIVIKGELTHSWTLHGMILNTHLNSYQLEVKITYQCSSAAK